MLFTKKLTSRGSSGPLAVLQPLRYQCIDQSFARPGANIHGVKHIFLLTGGDHGGNLQRFGTPWFRECALLIDGRTS